MKKIFVCLLASLVFSSVAMAEVGVKGYYRSNGTYVAPHHRTSPNQTSNDNWTTRGNVNPYTGEEGTRSRQYESNTRGYGTRDSSRSDRYMPNPYPRRY